jgi:hypothetical protein
LATILAASRPSSSWLDLRTRSMCVIFPSF